MNNDIFNKIKIGFELEFLIQYNGGPEINNIEDFVEDISCEKCIKNKKRIPYLSRDTIIHKYVSRFLANKFIQRGNGEYNFQVMDPNSKKVCDVDKSLSKKIDKWIITYDRSVSLLQVKEDFTKYYTDIDNIFSEKKYIEFLFDRNCIENLELVSPVMCIENYENKINHLFDEILNYHNSKELYIFNNSTTSNHIHMSFGNLLENPKHVYNICLYWLYFEPVIMSFVPYWRHQNFYCQSISFRLLRNCSFNKDKFIDIFKNKQYSNQTLSNIINLFQGDINDPNTRYSTLNILNLVKGGIGTIEIRVKHGSTDKNELIKYIDLFTKFFCNVLNKNKIYSKETIDMLYDSIGDKKKLKKAKKLFFDNIINDNSLKQYFTKKYKILKKKSKNLDCDSKNIKLGSCKIIDQVQ